MSADMPTTWPGQGSYERGSLHSGDIQLGRNILWLSMNENLVCAMSSLADMSSSIYEEREGEERGGKGEGEVRRDDREYTKGLLYVQRRNVG